MFDPASSPVLIEERLGFFKSYLSGYRLVDWTPERLQDVIADNPGIRAIVAAGEKAIPEAVASLPSLGLVALMGAGFEGIQVDRLRERGVEVTHSPGANAPDVADQAMTLLLAVARGVLEADRRVRDGLWVDRSTILTQPSIRDLKAGIVGMGAIGRALAERLSAFGCEISWHGPRPKADVTYPFVADLTELARQSDVLLLCHRADQSNAGMVDARVLEAIGPRGYLVNVSRGSAVDEDALIRALRDGTLGGAGLDVFEAEPVAAGRWSDVPRCVLSPHMGGIGSGAWRANGAKVRENLDCFFSGRPLVSPVPVA